MRNFQEMERGMTSRSKATEHKVCNDSCDETRFGLEPVAAKAYAE